VCVGTSLVLRGMGVGSNVPGGVEREREGDAIGDRHQVLHLIKSYLERCPLERERW